MCGKEFIVSDSGGERSMRVQTVKAASSEQGQSDLTQRPAGGAEKTTGRSGHANTQQKGTCTQTDGCLHDEYLSCVHDFSTPHHSIF